MDGQKNKYIFNDPADIRMPTFYRLTLIGEDQRASYSQIILLKPQANSFTVQVIQNPFRDIIRMNLQIPQKGKANIRLMDLQGRVILSREEELQEGSQLLELKGIERLAMGMYLLHMEYGNEDRNIRVIKDKYPQTLYLPAMQYNGQLIRTPDNRVRSCTYLATLLKKNPG